MQKELVISNKGDVLEIALLENGRLTELQKVSQNQGFLVGDIYLGKVKKLAVSLNAAFVDIGHEKQAFLHYHDLGPNFNSVQKYVQLVRTGKFNTHELKGYRNQKEIDKHGTIDQVLKPNTNILVQVVKEPISTKGPRITSELSIAGRFIVLVPFTDKISLSQKIKDEKERKRLNSLMKGIKPKGFGVIIRTVAVGKSLKDLHADLDDLILKWKTSNEGLSKKKTPLQVLSEMNRASSILRDNFNNDYTKIISDDSTLVKEIKDYIQTIAPEKSKIVHHYGQEALPLFEKFGIERQVKQSLGKTVNVPESKGGYLVIEHTEALHVIDVNSGITRRPTASQEDSALEINLKAATEIARQLRLRDMGGIIVVDFIDQTSSGHRKKLFDHFREEMRKDTAKHKVLPPSKFGLVQITRQRVRPELTIDTKENNPNKNDVVEAPIMIIDQIESNLRDVLTDSSIKKVHLHTHPFIASFLTKGFPSIRLKWFLKYKKWVTVHERDSYKYLQYSIKNEVNEVLNKGSN